MNGGLELNFNYKEDFIFRCGMVVGFYSSERTDVIKTEEISKIKKNGLYHVNANIGGLILFIVPKHLNSDYIVYKFKEVFGVENFYKFDPIKLDKHIITYKVFDMRNGIFETNNLIEVLISDCYSLDYFTSDYFDERIETRFSKKSKGWGYSDDLIDKDDVVIKDIIIKDNIKYDCETIIRQLSYHLSLYNYISYYYEKMKSRRTIFWYSVMIIFIVTIITLMIMKKTAF